MSTLAFDLGSSICSPASAADLIDEVAFASSLAFFKSKESLMNSRARCSGSSIFWIFVKRSLKLPLFGPLGLLSPQPAVVRRDNKQTTVTITVQLRLVIEDSFLSSRGLYELFMI